MTIAKTQENGKLTLAPEGRLDTTTAPLLEEALIPAFGQANAIHLDFSKVEYMSSAGLRVLLLGQKTAKEKGASMTISGISGEIMDVLEKTGFVSMLSIVE